MAINPRTLISSSNVDTLLLKSTLAESRLTFVNSGSATQNWTTTPNPYIFGKNILTQPILTNGTPVFSLSSAGYNFSLLQNDYVVAQFQANLNSNTTNFNVVGSINTGTFSILNNSQSRKEIILSDLNNRSLHTFSGIGHTYKITNYQVEGRDNVHAFFAGAGSNYSKEWMRLQENNLGNPQLGIGTNIFTSNVALEIAGNVNIQGSITASGGYYGFNTSGYVQLNSNTGRINSNVMPNNLVFLNSQNIIDNSLLNTNFSFQYLKSQKNVGIGVKNPVQKFQVQGSSSFSDRIGIGTLYPSSRIHAIENSASIPTVIFENNSGGDILQSYLSGSPAVSISGSHPGIGIGTANVPNGISLQVMGNANFTGNVTCCNINMQYVSGQSINITDPNVGAILRLETLTNSVNLGSLALRISVPLFCNLSIYTDTIAPISSHVTISSDLYVNGMIYAESIASTSDARLKNKVVPIINALDKIDWIRGYTFRYKYSNNKGGGVLAQELLQIMPEAVKTLPNGFYSVQYDAIIGLLIEAIRELKNKIQ